MFESTETARLGVIGQISEGPNGVRCQQDSLLGPLSGTRNVQTLDLLSIAEVKRVFN
jgi:hypothetical protein